MLFYALGLHRFFVSIRWAYCDLCNYDRHLCGGCGTVVGHGDGNTCDDCRILYDEINMNIRPNEGEFYPDWQREESSL